MHSFFKCQKQSFKNCTQKQDDFNLPVATEEKKIYTS